MSSPWYESFFGSLALDFWRAAVPPQLTEQEVQFLAWALAVEPPARLLDFPCGLGRHALALAARGYQVTGLDLSAEAIAAAQADAMAQGLSIRLERGDMRVPVPGGPYDGACCLGNSFGTWSTPRPNASSATSTRWSVPGAAGSSTPAWRRSRCFLTSSRSGRSRQAG